MTPKELRGKADAFEYAASRDGRTDARVDALWAAEHFRAHAAALEEVERLKAKIDDLDGQLGSVGLWNEKLRAERDALKRHASGMRDWIRTFSPGVVPQQVRDYETEFKGE